MSDTQPSTTSTSESTSAFGTEFVTVTTTFDDADWMRSFAHDVVEDGLAACVNIGPAGLSVYRWEGRIESEDEGVAHLHTTAERVDELVRRLADEHPYDEPQVLVTPATAPTPGYAAWLRDSTRTPRTS